MSVMLSDTAVRLDLKRSSPVFQGVVLGWLRNWTCLCGPKFKAEIGVVDQFCRTDVIFFLQILSKPPLSLPGGLYKVNETESWGWHIGNLTLYLGFFFSIVYSFFFSQPGFCRAAEDFGGMGNSWKSKFVSNVGWMLSNLICIVFNKALLPSLGMWPGRNPDRTLNKLSNPERKTCYKKGTGILRLVIVSD